MKYILILLLSSFSFASEIGPWTLAPKVKPTPTLSCPLRYPHLNVHLESLRQKRAYLQRKKVLIAGLGDFGTQDGQRSCPFLHEMLSFFSHKRISVVDFNPLVCLAVNDSVYPSHVARQVFENFKLDSMEAYIARRDKLSSYDPLNKDDFIQTLIAQAEKEHLHRENIIRNIISNIPERLPGHVNTLCKDFSEALTPDNFDFIFSINALIYALSNWDGRRTTEIIAKPNALEITKNFLNALRPRGNLYIDVRAFNLIRGLIRMSATEDLSGLDFVIDGKTFVATNIVPPLPAYMVRADSYNLRVNSSLIVRIERRTF